MPFCSFFFMEKRKKLFLLWHQRHELCIQQILAWEELYVTVGRELQQSFTKNCSIFAKRIKVSTVFRQLQLEFKWVSYRSLMLETAVPWGVSHQIPWWKSRASRWRVAVSTRLSWWCCINSTFSVLKNVKEQLALPFQVMLLKEIRTLLAQDGYLSGITLFRSWPGSARAQRSARHAD